MNSKVNHKINQVTEQTLVVGIDIAKYKHYATFVDERGREIKKAFLVPQSLEGFEELYQAILDAMKVFQKSEVLVGVEPTGHYWLNLAYFLEDRGIPLVIVNPMHVKRVKELDDNLQTKNDKKDALTIARLMKDGRYSHPKLLRDQGAEIRTGYSLRESLMKERSMLKNKLHRWIDKYFPELFHVFSDFGAMLLAVLEETPLPVDIVDMTPTELADICAKAGNMKQRRPTKAAELIQAAQSSIGITIAPWGARREVASMMRQYRLIEEELEAIEAELEERITQTADYEFLISVPGISHGTIAGLLAEIGSFDDYESPRQLIKLAGLTLRENSSGTYQGQKKISKRGRKRLRSLLFKAMLPILRNNEAFLTLHHYYTQRQVNPLRKKQSMVVLCGKLLKVLHALCTKKRRFDSHQMLTDLHCLQLAS
ncbi:IS110 family transposase [Sporosarcina sp. P7]|uniref:IS110 family transposase n=1 Tax=Sporosarcina sp. P7 TaxID=2048244 RepID=UPI000C172683|nr:IS110 family transposase [Sporosarcina sp. P7]PID23303.1 IS110 family transposase [Sporosarcina sp. P7]